MLCNFGSLAISNFILTENLKQNKNGGTQGRHQSCDMDVIIEKGGQSGKAMCIFMMAEKDKKAVKKLGGFF